MARAFFDLQAPDLDIPGVTDAPAAPAATGGGEETTPGTTTKAELNLWDMIVAGGPIMIVLGLLSAFVIGLLVFAMIDLQKSVKASPASSAASAAPMAQMMKASSLSKFTVPNTPKTSRGPLGTSAGDLGTGLGDGIEGGDRWKKWNDTVIPTILAAQQPDGAFMTKEHAYQTALATLALEAYYRYLPN